MFITILTKLVLIITIVRWLLIKFLIKLNKRDLCLVKSLKISLFHVSKLFCFYFQNIKKKKNFFTNKIHFHEHQHDFKVQIESEISSLELKLLWLFFFYNPTSEENNVKFKFSYSEKKLFLLLKQFTSKTTKSRPPSTLRKKKTKIFFLCHLQDCVPHSLIFAFFILKFPER